MQTIILQRISPIAQRPFRLPEVTSRNRLTIAHARHAHYHRPAKHRVGNVAIHPSLAPRLHRQLIVRPVKFLHNALAALHPTNVRHSAVAEIDSVRTILRIRNIIHQPRHNAILTAHLHRQSEAMRKLMNRNLIQQTEVWIIIARHVRSLHVVRGEMTEQVTFQIPLGVSLTLSPDVAEVRSHATAERQRPVLAVHRARKNLEPNQQSLLVIHYLGLISQNAHVSSHAVTLVVDKEGKLRRHTFLHHIRRQGIITENVPLHEIRQIQFRRRLHRQPHRVKLTAHGSTSVRVSIGKRTAKAILHRHGRRSKLRRNKRDGSRTRGVSIERPTIREVKITREDIERRRNNLELMACSHITVRVRHLQVELYVSHRLRLMTVEYG